MRPPSAGPTTNPRAEIIPPERPIARPRSAGEKSSVASANVFAIMSALPAACRPRKKINWPMFWEKPARSEVAV